MPPSDEATPEPMAGAPAGEARAKPSEARAKKKKRKRPKDCMECGTGKVCAKVQKRNEVLWLCRTCCIEVQDVYDRYGTIHKGEAPPIQVCQKAICLLSACFTRTPTPLWLCSHAL